MSSFTHFYETWFEHLHHQVHQLSEAPRPPSNPDQHQHLQQLIHKVMSHYAEYYRVKGLAAERDAVSILAAPWASSLERSLHWVAGWRPTTVFHLLYTESSIRFESHIADILRGLGTGDLGDLSPSQFLRISELQCETVREENAITEELSKWQDGGSELVGENGPLDEKMEGLAIVIKKADDLRLKTLRRVVELLTSHQAVEFIIAAAELQSGIRAWGKNRDLQRTNI